VAGLAAFGCRSAPEAETPRVDTSEEQDLVNRSAAVIEQLGTSGNLPALDVYLEGSKGVMIFPRVIRAALLFGGEGGNGVLLARSEAGSWSQPAFYTMGGANVGLQAGYREAEIVLFLTKESTVRSMVNRSVKLGADLSVAAGTAGDAGEARTALASADIIQLVSVGGVYAGASLDGAVVEDRESWNRDYYGPQATPWGIVIERRFENPGANVLLDALTGPPAPPSPAAQLDR
jgi:lipid-binding SYLF domain-containing protein